MVADIFVDGSCNQPFQNGFDCEGIIGENACGVSVRVYKLEVGMESQVAKFEYSNCWVSCVTSGLCELAALCFG